MRFSVVALMAATSVLFPGIASAQGVCVECRGPERGYRCAVKDAERVQQFRGGVRAIEYLCISEIARVGGHESCRAGTTYSGPCIGQLYEIDLAKAGGDTVVTGKPSSDGEGPAGGLPGKAGGTAVTAPEKGPPQTLEELARETVSKSKEKISSADEGVRKAGDAVGGAVKKSWDCLTSLFSRC